MNLAWGDEVPQIITPKTHQQSSEFLTPSAKRLLQQYLPTADVTALARDRSVTPSMGWGSLHDSIATQLKARRPGVLRTTRAWSASSLTANLVETSSSAEDRRPKPRVSTDYVRSRQSSTLARRLVSSDSAKISL